MYLIFNFHKNRFLKVSFEKVESKLFNKRFQQLGYCNAGSADRFQLVFTYNIFHYFCASNYKIH